MALKGQRPCPSRQGPYILSQIERCSQKLNPPHGQNGYNWASTKAKMVVSRAWAASNKAVASVVICWM